MKRIVIFLFISTLISGCTKNEDSYVGVYELYRNGEHHGRSYETGRFSYRAPKEYSYEHNDTCYDGHSILVVEKIPGVENRYDLCFTDTARYNVTTKKYKFTHHHYYATIIDRTVIIKNSERESNDVYGKNSYIYEVETTFDDSCSFINDTLTIYEHSIHRDYKNGELEDITFYNMNYTAIKKK